MISAMVDYLATFYQFGNLAQVEVIARSLLAAIPDDTVALQFLGLALYQTGRVDDAHRVFERVATQMDQMEKWDDLTGCEPTHIATFRSATRVHSGLADGWYQITLAMDMFGYSKPATRAFEAALAASGLNAEKHRRSTDENCSLQIPHANGPGFELSPGDNTGKQLV